MPKKSLGAASPISPEAVFYCGIVALAVGLLVCLSYPQPTKFQMACMTVLIALGASAFAMAISGFLVVESKWVRAGGPLGVFVFVSLLLGNFIAQ